MKKLNARMILILAIVGLIIIFSIQNSEVVQLRVFFWKVNTPRVLLILGSLIIGVIIGLLFPSKKNKR